MEGERHLTVEDLAERERTTVSTVYGWVHKGIAPPSMRIGKRRLFPLSGVIEWERRHMESAA